MSNLQLTHDQQQAKDGILQLITNPLPDNPIDRIIVVQGYAGTGKSTLLTQVLLDYYKLVSTYDLLGANYEPVQITVSAMTHKATEVLRTLLKSTGLHHRVPICTTHKAIGAAPKSSKAGSTNYHYYDGLITTTHPHLVVIDECSYMDSVLLERLMTLVYQYPICVLFMGDEHQLPPVNENTCPVFTAGFKTYHLNEVVRQKDAKHLDNCTTLLRQSVADNLLKPITPDDVQVIHLDKNQWDKQIIKSINAGIDTKVLHYTNHQVHRANNKIHNKVTGSADFKAGDLVCVNGNYDLYDSYYKVNYAQKDRVMLVTYAQKLELTSGNTTIPVYQLHISSITDTFRDVVTVLVNPKDKEHLTHKNLPFYGKDTQGNSITFMDIRHMYACTVHKSQGSTFDEVFININDFRNVYKTNLALTLRLLYVAFSRAKHRVYLTGDLS
ncbi:ATP-dependent RecD-like DNA helicase [Moraxella sp. ZJ142]|uniref:ATP-dependent DNA helicase n=1 Tax=Moraxella marmotae TaxID=3344520 RepID=UPI0035D432F1